MVSKELNEDEVFDGIMSEIGSDNRFQSRINYIFNLLFVGLAAMPFLNFVLAMAVPDHWCHVPGREFTNFTLEEWKNLTIPREDTGYSKCLMYNGTEEVACDRWEYDRTWYEETAPSQEDWVCDKTLHVTNIFVFGQIGEVVGTFIFGQLGDAIGRRPTFFLSVVLTALGRCLLTVTAHIYPLFLAICILGSSATPAAFQSPMALSMEVSAPHKRGTIAMMQCVGWTLGMCLMPLIAWVSRSWVIFLFLTSLPCTLVVFLHRQFPESPRWLVSRGKPEKCLTVLRYIAKVNGTQVPHGTMDKLQYIASKKERIFGVASLFTSFRLVKHTFLIALCRTIGVVTYYTLLLNVSNMSGNPFLNFLWQSAVELPGFFVGRYIGDRFGRRWSQGAVLFLVSVANFVVVAIVLNSDLSLGTTSLVVGIRFCLTIVNYLSYLQSMEMYPTCIRQTGTAVGNVAAGGLCIVGPYFVYLGTSIDLRYPYAILGTMTFFGAIAATFLPETLNQKLPETLRDAQTYGAEQPYWSFLPEPIKR